MKAFRWGEAAIQAGISPASCRRTGALIAAPCTPGQPLSVAGGGLRCGAAVPTAEPGPTRPILPSRPPARRGLQMSH